MSRLFIFSLSCISLFIGSCSSKYQIEGTANLSPLSGKVIYIKTYQNNQWNTLDSAQIIHGSFNMQGVVSDNTPRIATLFMDQIPLTPLLIEAGNITVDLNTSSFSIKGSPLNDKLYSFYEENMHLERKLNDSRHSIDSKINQAAIIDKHEELIKGFILQNRSNILSPAIYTVYKNIYPDLLQKDELKACFDDSINKDIANFHNIELGDESFTEYLSSYPSDFLLW